MPLFSGLLCKFQILATWFWVDWLIESPILATLHTRKNLQIQPDSIERHTRMKLINQHFVVHLGTRQGYICGKPCMHWERMVDDIWVRSIAHQHHHNGQVSRESPSPLYQIIHALPPSNVAWNIWCLKHRVCVRACAVINAMFLLCSKLLLCDFVYSFEGA